MSQSDPVTIIVTDHALLRYFERAHGLDVDFFRQHIAQLVATGVAEGASGVIVEGVRFTLKGSRVTTVLSRQMRPFDPGRKAGA